MYSGLLYVNNSRLYAYCRLILLHWNDKMLLDPWHIPAMGDLMNIINFVIISLLTSWGYVTSETQAALPGLITHA